jgi:hypothetical protein
MTYFILDRAIVASPLGKICRLCLGDDDVLGLFT